MTGVPPARGREGSTSVTLMQGTVLSSLFAVSGLKERRTPVRMTFTPTHRPCPGRRGSVLLIVLAVIALLAFAVATTVLTSSQYDLALGDRAALLRARRMADMGIALAVNPVVTAQDPLLQQNFSETEGFQTMLTTEESRLNINALLQEGRHQLLEQVFTNLRLQPAAAQGLVAALMDWTDADALKRRPDSAEMLDYKQIGFPNRPFNRPFRGLEELNMVAGIERLDAVFPAWRSLFTVYGSGQLDVNEASADTIALITGANAMLAQRLVQRRDGRDGLRHTKDDQLITSPGEALQLLGLPANHASSQLLSIQGQTARIESIGWSGDQVIGVALLVSGRGAGATRVLHREEFMPPPWAK